MSRENGGVDLHELWSADEMPVPLARALLAEETRVADLDRGSAPSTRASRPTSVEVSAERMLRPLREHPATGWRRTVSRVTAGLINVGPSIAELRDRELRARVKTPVSGCRRIAFVSRKGGVGKTSTCVLTGHAFALHRGDRVVCLDANPDAGTLGHRLRRENAATVTTLLSDAATIERYADIRAFTSQASSRLEVVAADDDPRVTEALGEEDYQRVIGLLERHYNLVLLDTGTGILDSATKGVLDAADQLVVVTLPTLDGTRAASLTLDWLEQNGYGELACQSVAVLNAVRPGPSALDHDRVEAHFRERCRACVRLPWDPHLDTGAEVDPQLLAPTTRDAYLVLAAELASAFSAPSPRRC